MQRNTIRVNNVHGTYAAWSAYVDQAIDRFLPASPYQLRLRLGEYLGHEISSTITVADMLVMLASPEAQQFDYDEHTCNAVYETK